MVISGFPPICTRLPAPSKTVVVPEFWFEIQKGPVAEKDMPHGSMRLAFVLFARPGTLETRSVWLKTVPADSALGDMDKARVQIALATSRMRRFTTIRWLLLPDS